MPRGRLQGPAPAIVRGCNGVVYEAHDPRTERYTAGDLIGVGAAPHMPLADHVLKYASEWPDQGISESCVGHAIAQAIHIRQGAMGILPHKRLRPSPTDIYYRARASRHGWENVIDIGSNPVAGWEVCRGDGPDSIGIASIDDMPWDWSTVDDPPSPSVYRRALERDWLRYHWVLSEGADRLTDVDALLATGRPVTVALTVDDGLQRWTPDQGPWRYSGPRKGGHYVCLVHGDRDGYHAIGTWGAGYGFAGLHWIDRGEIASSRCSYLATPDIAAGLVIT